MGRVHHAFPTFSTCWEDHWLYLGHSAQNTCYPCRWPGLGKTLVLTYPCPPTGHEQSPHFCEQRYSLSQLNMLVNPGSHLSGCLGDRQSLDRGREAWAPRLLISHGSYGALEIAHVNQDVP